MKKKLCWFLFGALAIATLAVSLNNLDHIQLANGIVIFGTNAAPGEAAPNGSFALRSTGQPYVRTNNLWVALTGGGGTGDGIPTMDGSGTNTALYKDEGAGAVK